MNVSARFDYAHAKSSDCHWVEVLLVVIET
jgi:hypothetical protein